MERISDKHRQFVESYCQHFNGARAAREAGYAESRDRQTAHRLLQDDDIKQMVDERLDEMETRSELPISSGLTNALLEKFGSIEEASAFIERVAFSVLDGGDLSSIKRAGISEDARYEVFYRAGFECQACGAAPSPDNDVTLEVDHIVPHSVGGPNDDSNLQALCAACNNSKDNKYAYDHNQDVDLLADQQQTA